MGVGERWGKGLFAATPWIAEAQMHDQMLGSDRDALLLAIPFIALLFIGLFRLDEVFFKSRRAGKGKRPLRPPSGVDQNGQPIFTDPDGKLNR